MKRAYSTLKLETISKLKIFILSIFYDFAVALHSFTEDLNYSKKSNFCPKIWAVSGKNFEICENQPTLICRNQVILRSDF